LMTGMGRDAVEDGFGGNIEVTREESDGDGTVRVTEIHGRTTELRTAYNTADVEAVLEIYSDGLLDMSDEFPSAYDEEAKVILRARLQRMFAEYNVEFAVGVVRILEWGERGLSFGWHDFALTDRATGAVTKTRMRYMELWGRERRVGERRPGERRPDEPEMSEPDAWRIVLCMDNAEHAPAMLPEVLAMVRSGVTARRPG